MFSALSVCVRKVVVEVGIFWIKAQDVEAVNIEDLCRFMRQLFQVVLCGIFDRYYIFLFGHGCDCTLCCLTEVSGCHDLFPLRIWRFAKVVAGRRSCYVE